MLLFLWKNDNNPISQKSSFRQATAWKTKQDLCLISFFLLYSWWCNYWSRVKCAQYQSWTHENYSRFITEPRTCAEHTLNWHRHFKCTHEEKGRIMRAAETHVWTVAGFALTSSFWYFTGYNPIYWEKIIIGSWSDLWKKHNLLCTTTMIQISLGKQWVITLLFNQCRSPKYDCAPYSQSTMPSKLHSFPTLAAGTSLALCMHVCVCVCVLHILI